MLGRRHLLAVPSGGPLVWRLRQFLDEQEFLRPVNEPNSVQFSLFIVQLHEKTIFAENQILTRNLAAHRTELRLF